MNERFIGLADLSVRLNSMNPLRYVKIDKAAVSFERLVLTSCLDTAYNSNDMQSLMKNGIINQGATEKRFEFDRVADCLFFVQTLRTYLLEEKLPFKICIRRSRSASQTLKDRWTSLLPVIRDGGDPNISRRAREELGTSNIDHILTLFSLHRAATSDAESARLSADAEAFKGMGFFASDDFDPESLEGGVSKLFFRNHFPRRVGAKYVAEPYYDIVFSFSESDLIERSTDNEAPAPLASAGLIANVMELMARSVKADPLSGAFYVSILNAFVVSSNFSRIRYLSGRESVEDDSATSSVGAGAKRRQRETGWQFFPPVFEVLMLSAANRAILKKIPGIEIPIASMVSKIVSNTDDVAEKRAILRHITRQVEYYYGEPMIRRMLALPDTVASEIVRQGILEAASST